MRERIKALNRYQKGILLVMLAMTLVFTAVYAATISRVGIVYNGAILVPVQQDGGTVYSGKVNGQPMSITVSAEKAVVFQYGQTIYGPYTAKQDPAAVPKDVDVAAHLTGVELRRGEEIVFRGGVLDADGYYLLYNEDGTSEHFGFSVVFNDGTARDEHGNVIDPMEPTVSTVLELMHEPELTHKGNWGAWVQAVFLCVLNAVTILFAEELFRLNLSFQIRDAYGAEPSDWEIAGRYVGWTVITVSALLVFATGLQ